MSENSAAKQRLLIVDDSKVIRVTARKILQNHFDTVEAVDGENAWELLTAGPDFALVVSDLTMPKLDGFGLLEKIRTSLEPGINSVPVIIITGANDSEATMQRARAAGATDFIGKPFDAVHLLARTQAHASAYTTNESMRRHAMSLEEQVPVDVQTGLATESAFMERGFQLLSYAIRHNDRLAMAQVEIDQFGDLFRKHGKTITDLALEHTADALLAGIRKEDQAARIGTARFAILFPGMDASGARNLAERLSGDIRSRILRAGNRQVRSTVSIGIAALTIGRDSRLDTLLDAAGNGLHAAVAAGGDQTVVHNAGDSPRDTGRHDVPDHWPAPETTGVPADSRPAPEPAEVTEITVLTSSSPALPELEELLEITADPVMPAAGRADVAPGDDSLTIPDEPAPEYQLDEEIVITSPYGIFEMHRESSTTDPAAADDSPGPAATAPTDPAAVNAEAAEAAARDAATGATEPVPGEFSAPPRPGVFRRMVRRLFGT